MSTNALTKIAEEQLSKVADDFWVVPVSGFYSRQKSRYKDAENNAFASAGACFVFCIIGILFAGIFGWGITVFVSCVSEPRYIYLSAENLVAPGNTDSTTVVKHGLIKPEKHNKM